MNDADLAAKLNSLCIVCLQPLEVEGGTVEITDSIGTVTAKLCLACNTPLDRHESYAKTLAPLTNLRTLRSSCEAGLKESGT